MARPLRIAHFLEAARYIVLNPLRTVRPRRFTDWRWSSYPATAGLSPRPPSSRSKRFWPRSRPSSTSHARAGTADTSYGYSLREIAAHLGVSAATVSRALAQIEQTNS